MLFLLELQMYLYVALARHPLVAIISNHLDGLKQKLNARWLAVAPASNIGYLENAGIWVQAHPILTTVIIVSVLAGTGLTVTYFFYPHLLGFASTASGVTATQLIETQRKSKALEEALVKATTDLAAEQGLRSVAENAVNVLESTLAEKSAEVLMEQGLRVAAQTANTVLESSLAEKSAEVLMEQGLRVAAQAAKEIVQVKSPAGERLFLEGLTRVLAENPEHLVVKPHGNITMSSDRLDVIMSSMTESIQLTLNLLSRKPINTPIPPAMYENVANTARGCVDFVIQTFFG